jgi:hypothetical protein
MIERFESWYKRGMPHLWTVISVFRTLKYVFVNQVGHYFILNLVSSLVARIEGVE